MFSNKILKLLTSYLLLITPSFAGIIEKSLEILPHKNYATSSQLTNLAQNSAIQAKNAVNIQQISANHAAFNAQNALAQIAFNAATTAQAALAGKQVHVKRIQLQLAEAQNQLQMRTIQFNLIKNIAEIMQKSAQEARDQLHRISEMLTAARKSADGARQVADDAGKLKAVQNIVNQEAKRKVEELREKFEESLREVKEGKSLAEEAETSSDFAKISVDSTESLITVELEKKNGEIVAESVVEKKTTEKNEIEDNKTEDKSKEKEKFVE